MKEWARENLPFLKNRKKVPPEPVAQQPESREQRVVLPDVDNSFTKFLQVAAVEKPIIIRSGYAPVFTHEGEKRNKAEIDTTSDLSAFIPETQEIYFVPARYTQDEGLNPTSENFDLEYARSRAGSTAILEEGIQIMPVAKYAFTSSLEGRGDITRTVRSLRTFQTEMINIMRTNFSFPENQEAINTAAEVFFNTVQQEQQLLPLPAMQTELSRRYNPRLF